MAADSVLSPSVHGPDLSCGAVHSLPDMAEALKAEVAETPAAGILF